ncbi:thioesterase family protein [Marinitenerispora sediminis]|uniref:thioesterase family protein n=1 Tax=Marinitenerispora sediminis TaxID=1931232 RepID=UPI000DF317AD|nr:thioesterase family protein [Marinitenerispora sediminis]RCV51063.1 thioesterase family protein [Marinitenerispora sediminis]
MSRFEAATAVTKRDGGPDGGSGGYSAELDPGYLIGSALNGGYLMAVLQRAALAESAHPHPVSSSFRTAGPADAEVTVLKAGRTVTASQVLLRQNGRPLVTGLLTSAALDPAADPEYGVPAPDVPPIENCRPFDPRQSRDVIGGFTDRVELRFAADSFAALSASLLPGEAATDRPAPAGRVELLGHVAPAATDGGAPADPVAFLPLAVDALPPIVSVLRPWQWAPTVELTWHLRAVPHPGPLAFRSRTDLVSDGWFDETVDLWDVKGRLVAQSRQLARVGR